MSSGTSVVPFTKKATTLPAIDSNNDSVPPLDYSYLKLANLSDIYEEEPRPYLLQKKTGTTSTAPSKDVKSKSRCLRLNNNALPAITELPKIVSHLFQDASCLGWLDLSFNELTTIDPILCDLTGLEILYLHGNQITNILEADKLQSLTKLRKLTLHGNSIENETGYRQHLIAMMPWLLNFDFSAVTKADRVTATNWQKMNKTPKRKKKEA